MPHSRGAPVFKALNEPCAVSEWQRQRDRLAEIFGDELADRYFVFVDTAASIPNQEVLDAASEAAALVRFMLRNCLTIEQMQDWILASEEEVRCIEEWCRGDLGLLAFTNRMMDFRREVWGKFLLLLEAKGDRYASSNSYTDERRSQRASAVCL